MSTSASTPPPVEGTEMWSIRGLIVRHKAASLVVAGLCTVTVGVSVLAAIGSKAAAVTDATTCTQWGNVNWNRQMAYGRLYVQEHGAVPNYGSSPQGVINAINFGCGEAFGDDVSDTATVVQAIRGTF